MWWRVIPNPRVFQTAEYVHSLTDWLIDWLIVSSITAIIVGSRWIKKSLNPVHCARCAVVIDPAAFPAYVLPTANFCSSLFTILIFHHQLICSIPDIITIPSSSSSSLSSSSSSSLFVFWNILVLLFNDDGFKCRIVLRAAHCSVSSVFRTFRCPATLAASSYQWDRKRLSIAISVCSDEPRAACGKWACTRRSKPLERTALRLVLTVEQVSWTIIPWVFFGDDDLIWWWWWWWRWWW